MKKIRILVVLTVLYFIVWIIAAFAYSLTHGMPERLPRSYVHPISGLAIFWLLIGIYALIKHFKTIKEHVFNFINDKNYL